jgi:hypothetical protein
MTIVTLIFVGANAWEQVPWSTSFAELFWLVCLSSQWYSPLTRSWVEQIEVAPIDRAARAIIRDRVAGMVHPARHQRYTAPIWCRKRKFISAN